MLIVNRNGVLNLSNVDIINTTLYEDAWRLTAWIDQRRYFKLGEYGTKKEAEKVLAGIVDAYEHGRDVYRF